MRVYMCIYMYIYIVDIRVFVSLIVIIMACAEHENPTYVSDVLFVTTVDKLFVY